MICAVGIKKAIMEKASMVPLGFKVELGSKEQTEMLLGLFHIRSSDEP